MHAKPALPDTALAEFLRQQYGLSPDAIVFLPTNYEYTAAYRVEAGGRPYFLKLRRDPLDENAVAVPLFLSQHGLRQIIAPVAATSGQHWAELAEFNVILYPFVAGRNGFEAPLTEPQWAAFGAALQAIHSLSLPAELSRRLPAETYGPYWREKVTALLERARRETFADPAAAQMAELLVTKAEAIGDLIQRAERLAADLRAQTPPRVLCHSDIHAGNLLLSDAGELYIVDWDNPILAPRERDLMHIGAGIGGNWDTPEEEARFYGGYGPAAINAAALAYYRCERIVEDLAAYADQLLDSDIGGSERAATVEAIGRWFRPKGVVGLAYRTSE